MMTRIPMLIALSLLAAGSLLGCDGASSTPPEATAEPAAQDAPASAPAAEASSLVSAEAGCLTAPPKNGSYKAVYTSGNGEDKLVLHRLGDEACAIQYPNSRLIEIVRKQGVNHEISLERRFPQLRRGIVYTQADLQDIGRETDFDAFCGFFPPKYRVGAGQDEEYRCLKAVSYTHLRAHETVLDLVCRLLLEKKN